MYAARGLASIELSFHLYNTLRDSRRGVSRGNKNVAKIANFGLTHWLKHRITRKLLKIDRYMLWGVWQALNCLSIYATYCVIVAGASPGIQKCGLRYVKTAIFNCCKLHNFITVVNYTIFAAIIASFMSVAYVRELLVYVFWQKVLPYLNNFTNQHRAVCQR